MKILVIGAAGFVGPHLLRHLREDLLDEVTATKLSQERILWDGPVRDLDILDKTAVEACLEEERPDFIVHLAAQSSVALSWKYPQRTAEINIVGTLNVLEAARRLSPLPGFLLIGSGEEYGQLSAEQIPVEESTPLHPANVYAATKAASEQLAAVYVRAYGMRIVSVRAFNHIGRGQSPAFAVSDFCKQAAEIEMNLREPVIRTGNLTAARDFTDVRDIVRAYGLLIRKGKAGEIYNVGSGKAVRLETILEMIKSLSKVPFETETDPKKLRPVDVPLIEADIHKLQQDTGWRPQIPLRQSLSDVLDDWRELLHTKQEKEHGFSA